MRQISLLDAARTRQMHILTTRTDLTPGEIRYRMGSRWRQENHYRYARLHFDFDSHDSYRAGDDDPTRMVPNPAKKAAYAQVEKARRAVHLAQNLSDTALLAAHSPKPGTTVLLTNTMINTINTDTHTANATLDAAITAHQGIPARLPLAQVHPGQQILDTETKLIHHAIRIAAYNTAQSLARTIATDTGYSRAQDEAHTLIRTALAGSGDIIPDPTTNTLHIRLDPLPAPRHTAAINELCQVLNDTNTIYPGTSLTLRYSTKPHRSPHTHYCAMSGVLLCHERRRELYRRSFVMRCSTSDEGRPFRTALRGEVLNQHMLRWLKTVVVSDVRKGARDGVRWGTGRRTQVNRC